MNKVNNHGRSPTFASGSLGFTSDFLVFAHAQANQILLSHCAFPAVAFQLAPLIPNSATPRYGIVWNNILFLCIGPEKQRAKPT